MTNPIPTCPVCADNRIEYCDCGDVGYTSYIDRVGDQCQEMCEFCHRNEFSVYNTKIALDLGRELVAKYGIHTLAELESRIKLADHCIAIDLDSTEVLDKALECYINRPRHLSVAPDPRVAVLDMIGITQKSEIAHLVDALSTLIDGGKAVWFHHDLMDKINRIAAQRWKVEG